MPLGDGALVFKGRTLTLEHLRAAKHTACCPGLKS